MELWQRDIVGGIRLADGGEAKVVTGAEVPRTTTKPIARFKSETRATPDPNHQQ